MGLGLGFEIDIRTISGRGWAFFGEGLGLEIDGNLGRRLERYPRYFDDENNDQRNSYLISAADLAD